MQFNNVLGNGLYNAKLNLADVFADFSNSVRDIQPTRVVCTIRYAPTNTADNTLSVAAQLKTGAVFSTSITVSSSPVKMLDPIKPTTISLDFNRLGPWYQRPWNITNTNTFSLCDIRFYGRGASNATCAVLIKVTGYGIMLPQDEWQIVIPSLTQMPSTAFSPADEDHLPSDADTTDSVSTQIHPRFYSRDTLTRPPLCEMPQPLD
jgi:hypothetical protein